MNHDESLLELMIKPKLLNLEDVGCVSRNTILFDEGKVVGEIDIIYHHTTNKITVVEYKRTRHNYTKALHQLDFASHFIEHNYMVVPDKLFVWRDQNKYKVEQV